MRPVVRRCAPRPGGRSGSPARPSWTPLGESFILAHPGQPRTFWALFLVFVLGPCEPLIPLFVLPASRGRWDIALWTFAAFAITTLVTMLMATCLGLVGLKKLPFGNLERWVHAMAGGAIASSGFAVITLGL